LDASVLYISTKFALSPYFPLIFKAISRKYGIMILTGHGKDGTI